MVPLEQMAEGVSALSLAMKLRDGETGAHCVRVSRLAVEMGRLCGLPWKDLVALQTAAVMHDVGKIGVPDAVLLKPGRLDERERAIMQTHAYFGYELLRGNDPVARMGAVAQVTLWHHEAFDGSGYPNGLVGEAIPLLARIVSLADCYDAMASARAYHARRSHGEVMKLLVEENAAKYDPGLLKLFVPMIERSPHRAPLVVH